jgi:chromosome segregation ATPase
MSWLCYEHQWAKWELLTIAATALVLLLLIVRQLRKRTVTRAYANQVRERSPIIGVKLADHQPSHQRINGSEKGRSARVPERRGRDKKLTKTTRQLEKSNEQIRQLQHEITKHRQTEERLEHQVGELTAANEQLRHEVTESKRAGEHLRQQAAELTAASQKFRHERLEQRQSEKVPAESSRQESKAKRQAMPLKIEELKKVAELAKRVSGRL